jgi:PAS domain S-box-containing protein
MDEPNGRDERRHEETATRASANAADLGFGLLFNKTQDAVIIGNARTGRIVLANPAAARLFGYTEEELAELPIARLVSDELRSRHLAGIAAFAERGRGDVIDAGRPIEVTAQRKDGSHVLIELGLTALQEPTSERRYVAAIIRDVTARRRLEQERATVLAAAQEYAHRLEELTTLKASFTGMVAHELMTPISAIRGLTDLLLADQIGAAQRPALIEAIRAEADLLRRLVADVQAAATIEGDDFAVQLRPVAALSLLADAAGFARALSSSHPFREEIEDAATTATVLADPERIKQVLRNLLGNAAKHTPAGTAMALRASCDGEQVWIEVADAGPGIPLAELERIFEKFGRGRDAEGRRVPGVGLGLYLSRRIVRAHGGELTVVSNPAEGTVFTFALRCA